MTRAEEGLATTTPKIRPVGSKLHHGVNWIRVVTNAGDTNGQVKTCRGKILFFVINVNISSFFNIGLKDTSFNPEPLCFFKNEVHKGGTCS